ncbi:secretin receptor-like [Tropilaelaps mercedesae]|uniref:Secretin receptor-like n=1 Tax=Tropilaelaps mercedesae TaxID=418985 RepID=A0A1V9XJ73_9ACAR|nr:secretin receptor-like [Tropilaelaps mercedesae]
MLRASVILAKDFLFIDGVGFRKDLESNQKAPICITVVLNFCLFVRISRVLLNRVLRPEIQPASANQQHTYKEWFKASLILIPLLASHYVVLLAMNLLSNLMPPIVEIVWFYIDALFTSFQGAFVSFLYCFASPEVHSHLRRKLHASRGEGSFQSSNTKCKRFRLRRIQHYSDCHNNAAGKGQGPRLTSASPVICAGNKSTYETHQQNIDRLSCSEQRYKGILIKNTSSADCVINQVNRIACSNCTTTSKTGNEQTDV